MKVRYSRRALLQLASLREYLVVECTLASGQGSRCVFDHLPGVLLFEPDGAPVT